MRIVFLGVGHWHFRIYAETLARESGIEVVGVSDPDPKTAEAAASRMGCCGFTDYRHMCESVRPDFAFAIGRHAAMAAEGDYLIEAGIPFSLEKPCGVSYAEVNAIADKAARKNAFASATFGFRYSEMFRRVSDIAAADDLLFMSTRGIGGSAYRYRNYRPDSSWILDPSEAGGGPLINLGIHFLQLFRMLVKGRRVTVRSAARSNLGYGFPVEDYVAVQLEAEGALGLVETGYSYASRPREPDMRYTFRTNNHYFIVPDEETLEVTDVAAVDAVLARNVPDEFNDLMASPDLKGAWQSLRVSAKRFPQLWMTETLRRARAGEMPAENLSDMADCLRLVEEAYALAGPLAPASRVAAE